MATEITFEEFRNRSLKAEGTLTWLSALKNKLLVAIATKFMLYSMKKIEQGTDLEHWDRETSELILSVLKNLHNKYHEGLSHMLDQRFPFVTKQEKIQLTHYEGFLEDVIESLEIGLDPQLASKIEAAAKGINPPKEIPPWREVIEQI